MYEPESDSLAIDEPTTLHIPYIKAPLDLANLIAARVSAVSPDWDIAIIISSLLTTGSLYLNSEAYSTSTEILAIFSNIYSAIKAECHDVPQAIIVILFADKNLLI